MHILSVPSFFVTNRTGQPHGDELGRMKPFSNEASSWVFSSANSCGTILYGRLEIGVVPGIRSTIELYTPVGRHSRQLFRKDIREVTNHRNIFKVWKWKHIQSM